jgi:hypothetical protein
MLMPAFRILVFRDVSLVDGFEVFKSANQRNNNVVETSNFADATFPNLTRLEDRRICVCTRKMI